MDLVSSASATYDENFYRALDAIVKGDYCDPHHLLGLHDCFNGQKVIRVFRPGAEQIYIEVFDQLVAPEKIHGGGVFEYTVPSYTTFTDYRTYHQDGSLYCDPYAFASTLGELDAYLLSQGVHYDLYNVLGAHTTVHQGIVGTKFAVWAPSAKRVSVVGDFNHWNGTTNPMRTTGGCGVWEIFIPGINEGMKYKFEIKTQEGQVKLKFDPFAHSSEMRPSTASIVFNLDQHAWQDDQWMQQAHIDKPKPINIYEVHLGSWKKNSSSEFIGYRELAHELSQYCTEMGFTHIELMPIAEHPLDESWGYQVTGFYAVSSRYGSPRDFQYFVDVMHQKGIGVILDWVPAHFPTDDFSLARFDGTALYEHADPRQGFHPHWNTYIFNYGRKEVCNYLIANALFWFDKMHIDGLRVDAVASMLYLDYGRASDEWVPNVYGGKENLAAIEMLKHLNSVVHLRFPGRLMIAEESTAFSGVTAAVEHGGLGFDLKWNMGWMNDTLRYFQKDPLYRSHHHHDLTFGLVYAFSEKFALVLSHDEVVHGKRSLLSKMPGDMWQKFANLRLLYSYTMCQPGKKLFFMGGEIGQWNEWNCKGQIEWELLEFPLHHQLKQMVCDLNHLYLAHDALWQDDFNHRGFEWVSFSDHSNCAISYKRRGSQGDLLCVHNFLPAYHEKYILNLSHVRSIKMVFNSDDARYGGSNKREIEPQIIFDEEKHAQAVEIEVAPLATLIFAVEYI